MGSLPTPSLIWLSSGVPSGIANKLQEDDLRVSITGQSGQQTPQFHFQD